jgi:hypothetical protein
MAVSLALCVSISMFFVWTGLCLSLSEGKEGGELRLGERAALRYHPRLAVDGVSGWNLLD